MGDEGGFAPNITSPEEALRLLTKAIAEAGHAGKIKLGSDPAASEFFSFSASRSDGRCVMTCPFYSLSPGFPPHSFFLSL